MTTGRHRAGSGRPRSGIFAMVLMATLALGQASVIALAAPPGDSPGPPSAQGVQPVIVDTQSSNDDCGELGFDHGISIAGNGQISSGSLTVTVTGYNSPSGFVDWSSNQPIHGVYVKGGPGGGNLFSYPSGDTGDQDLHTPQKSDGSYYGVSHVAFCRNDVAAEPDVTIEKSNDPTGVVVAGGSITYTLTVTNDGDAAATEVEVTDDLPAGVSFVSASSSCSEAAGVVSCSLGDIAADTSIDVEITVSVDEETCGTLSNVADVAAANESGGATENNTSNEVSNTVTCDESSPPDLEVTKTSDADGLLQEGDIFSYTITVSNVGEEAATGVRVHDDLPAGVGVLVSPFPTLKGEFCIVASSVEVGGIPRASVHCGPVSLDPGESASVTIRAEVTGDVCGTITNLVRVEGTNEPAANAGSDNRAEASDEVECAPRIRLVKGGDDLAHVGDSVTYTFAATNNGGVDLTDIELTDPMCDGPITQTDDGDGDAILAVGERWEYTCDHTITAGDGDPVRNEATVQGTHEGGTVSDTDTHIVDVIHPGISIVKTASPTSGQAGAQIVYTYTVTSTGDTKLFDIVVSDDKLGEIGEIASLASGASAQLTAGFTLGSSPVTNVGTASGEDVLGGSVRAQDSATVSVVSGSGGGDGDGGGSPFTGADTRDLAVFVLVLSAVGAALVAGTRRRPGAAD